jgi:hypothetical protein
MHANFRPENLKGRDHLEDPRHRWKDSIRIDQRFGLDASSSGQGLVAGSCEHSMNLQVP